MAKVLVVGLNPAWQTVLEFAALAPGHVNRAQLKTSLASGKGINTAKVLRRLGHEVWLLQILGGINGKRCLEGCEAMGIHSFTAWSDSETRQCLTLVDGASGAATEIIEPFTVTQPEMMDMLLSELLQAPETFDGLAICGTVPPGVSETIYGELLSRYRTRVSVVDAWQGLDAASMAKATCLKMNASELLALEKRLGGLPASPLFAVTAGAGEACMLRGGGTLARFSPAKLEKPEKAVNPIGAGDTVTAGLVHNLLAGLDETEAFRRALALGSASCLNILPAEFSDDDYLRLLPMVGMKKTGTKNG